jgi:hypothetical protein
MSCQLILMNFQIEIEIDRYHSIFACPILRQQSTDENPPVKLVSSQLILVKTVNSNLSFPFRNAVMLLAETL